MSASEKGFLIGIGIALFNFAMLVFILWRSMGSPGVCK